LIRSSSVFKYAADTDARCLLEVAELVLILTAPAENNRASEERFTTGVRRPKFNAPLAKHLYSRKHLIQAKSEARIVEG
jgi:hypothetical protein